MQRFLDSLAFSQPYLLGLLILVIVLFFASAVRPRVRIRRVTLATLPPRQRPPLWRICRAKEGDGKARTRPSAQQ